MAGVNKAILIGNLGKDPEIRVIESGRKVANFTIATTESYKDKNGERVENTEWHNIVFWGPIADVIEKYLKKGGQVYVEGKIRTRSYEDKDKIKRYITEILGQNLTLLGRPGGESGGQQSSNVPSHNTSSSRSNSPEPIGQQFVADADMDDLPF